MSVVVFCNLGSRDVVLTDAPTERPPFAREAGQQYWAALATYGTRLDFPILNPAIEYILDQESGIDELVLLGTDQSDVRHQRGDTLYYAMLAEALLPSRFEGRIQRATHHLVGKEPPANPTLYDEMFRVYEELLRPFAEKPIDACYLIISGGIPACNTALLFQGIRYFGDRCQLVYLAEGNPQPIPLGIGQQIMDVMQENRIHEMLDRFDFSAASSLLQKRPSVPPLAPALLNYARSRLWFDFSGAQSYLTQAIKESQADVRTMLQKEQASLSALANADKKEIALIGEVYHNAMIAWDNERFVDFLGRAQRFQEAVTAYLLAQIQQQNSSFAHLKPELISRQAEARQTAVALIGATYKTAQGTAEQIPAQHKVTLANMLEKAFNLPELDALMFDLSVDYENISGDTKNIRARELVAHAVRNNYFPNLVDAIQKLRPHLDFSALSDWKQKTTSGILGDGLRRLEALAPLREQTIIAHGYAGVSEAIILETYNQAEGDGEFHPRRDMTMICIELGISIENPFRVAQTLIKQALR